jgi:riboflavin kinase/FMN adenylyltransferase
MNVVDQATDLPALSRSVAIGTFDGVHLGHRHLLRRTDQPSLVSTVVTFDPHPRLVLGRQVRLISSLARRLELLASLGVADVVVVPFTLEMSRMQPQEWADKVLRPMGTRRVVVGENYRFGHRASGGPATLQAMGFDVDSVSFASGASSTRIRQLVELGHLHTASELLGRPIEIEAVSEDDTANLSIVRTPATLLPPSGHYLASADGVPAHVELDAVFGRLRMTWSDDRPRPVEPLIRVQLDRRRPMAA